MAKPKLTKTTVELDLSKVSARDRRAKTRIPEGNYNARVHSAEVGKFGTGSKGVKWVFEVIDDGPGNGARLFYNTVLIDPEGNTAKDSLWSFRGVLQALSPAVKIKDSMMKIPLSKLVGRECALEVGDDEYEDKIRSTILDVFNQDLIDDDEDELDDEDEDEDEEEDEDDDDDEVDLDEDEL